MKKKGKENLSIIDTYISHEFLEIVGIVSEAVHENYGNGHINSEFSNLQNPLWCPQRRHFSFFFLSIKIPKTFFQLWSIWIIDMTKSWVSQMRWRRVNKGFVDYEWKEQRRGYVKGLESASGFGRSFHVEMGQLWAGLGPAAILVLFQQFSLSSSKVYSLP